MADVFISYKRERRPAARHLEQILIRYGYTVWFDLALVRGADYEEQIQRELNAAKAVIVLWCGLSVQSPGVRSEASRAKAQGKLVPVVIERCELPLFSTLEQNIDLEFASGSPRDHALDPILDDLERLVGRPPTADLKALREYEATWRTMTGGLPLAKLPLEQVAMLETEGVPASPSPIAEPSHDYAFWKAEWEAHRGGSDLHALKSIADHAPPYFASQARQRAEQERIAKEKAAAEERAARFRAEGRIKVDAAIFAPGDGEASQAGWLKPGGGKTEWFKDIDIGPEMVVVPGAGGIESFAIGRFALTFAEWDDAQAYCKWLSAITAKTYRLPSEAEWEHACRAGSKTEFWWGNEISTDQANYDGNYTFGNGKKGEYRQRTVPVDSFEANPWGLYQVHGNVREWCEDAIGLSSHVVSGGSWSDAPNDIHSGSSNRGQRDVRTDIRGFRVVRSLSPARTL